MALTGNETLQVLGQDNNGAPAATTQTTTVAAIAALASLDTSNVLITPLNTVGNGTITAAGIVGKITTRGGSQSGTPFTDTTATAAAIIALLPGSAPAGTSFQYTYENRTNATATITGGTGVTVSNVTVIPANGFVRYLVTYSAAATVTVVGFETGSFVADSTDPTKVIGFQASSEGTGHTAIIAAANSADATYTLPAATDTLVGRASSDTLTNKTLTSPVIATIVNSGTLTLPTPNVSDTLVGRATTDTLTNKTFTSPVLNTATVNTGSTLNDVITKGTVLVTAQTNFSANTTLANVTGLSVALTNSGTYQVYASLPVSVASAAAGVQLALSGSNGLGLTSVDYAGKFLTAAAIATVNTTVLGGGVGSTAAVVLAELTGGLVVNTGGTLTVQAAQNVSSAGTTSILINGFLEVTRVS